MIQIGSNFQYPSENHERSVYRTNLARWETKTHIRILSDADQPIQMTSHWLLLPNVVTDDCFVCYKIETRESLVNLRWRNVLFKNRNSLLILRQPRLGSSPGRREDLFGISAIPRNCNPKTSLVLRRQSFCSVYGWCDPSVHQSLLKSPSTESGIQTLESRYLWVYSVALANKKSLWRNLGEGVLVKGSLWF